MSKELTPLEALKEIKETEIFVDFELNTTCAKMFEKQLGIIETALKEYELMKQTKIIVANKKISDDDLEKLKNQRVFVGNLEQCEIKPLFDEETVKKLKALQIIKEKRVNLEYLKCCETYKQYKTICSYWNEITQEEYDLLKVVLKK